MERIGIIGGMFDPPHIGHVRAAQTAIEQHGLDMLYVIPVRTVPNDAALTFASVQNRLEMTRLAFAGVEKTAVLDVAEGTMTDAVRKLHPDALITTLDAEPAVSSEDVRRLLLFRCAKSFLPKTVMAYIESRRLYGVWEDYKNLPMERLEQVVISLLKRKRIDHVLGCRDAAMELAKIWGADVTDAARAGLLHDVTKALDGPLQLTICGEYGTLLDDFSKENPKTLHALTGSMVARDVFGENEAVVSAIRSHTTGKGGMNTLEKIIYVADYMEPNRKFPGVEELRKMAYTDLDGALKLGLETTLKHLQNQGAEVSPATQDALRYLNLTV